MTRLIISLKSMTHAQKAKRLLSSHRIMCEIVGLDRSLTENGCAYGIAFSSKDYDAVYAVLKSASLAYGELLGKS